MFGLVCVCICCGGLVGEVWFCGWIDFVVVVELVGELGILMCILFFGLFWSGCMFWSFMVVFCVWLFVVSVFCFLFWNKFGVVCIFLYEFLVVIVVIILFDEVFVYFFLFCFFCIIFWILFFLWWYCFWFYLVCDFEIWFYVYVCLNWLIL